MSLVHVTRFEPSDKYNDDGDHFRMQIDGQWYSAYLTPDAVVEPGDHDVEFKTSPKNGKVYAIAVDGMFRKPPGGGQRAAPRQQAIPGSAARQAAAVGLHPPAPAESKAGAKDMWIMATSILQAVIAKDGCAHGNLVDLAREAANAARAAARVFDGAALDAAKAAAERPAVPRPAHPQPAPVDPGYPRETGPDFDDDIPF